MSTLLLVLKIVLSAVFACAGIAKLIRAKPLVAQFHDFHLPLEIMTFIGILELLGAAVLWYEPISFWVLASLACLMVGAVKSHIAAKHPVSRLLPAGVLFGLCAWAAALAHWLGQSYTG